jgi:integrase
MPKMKLTETAIARMRAPHPDGKQTLYWDTELKGFAVCCSGVTNSRTYVCQWDLPGRKTRRVNIGNVAEITLEAARHEAADLVHGMRKGLDPKSHHRGKAAATLKTVLDDFLAKRSDLREASRAEYKRSIEVHLKDWCDRPLRDITGDEVEKRFEEIQKGIEARETKKRNHRATVGPAEAILARVNAALPEIASDSRRSLSVLTSNLKRALDDGDEAAIRNRTVSLARAASRFISTEEIERLTKPQISSIEVNGKATANAVFTNFQALWNFWAEKVPDFPPNPTKRLRRQWHTMKRRTRMVAAEDLPKFYAAIDALPSRTASDYLKLLVLTGMRREEAAGLRWDEVDLTSRVIRLPAERMKNRRPFTLPLTDLTFNLLTSRRALGREEFVFASNSRSGYIAEPKFPLTEVAKKCGIDVSPHDLRRTYASVAEGVVSGIALKKLLGHVTDTDVTSGYVIMNTEALRVEAQRVADRMRELCQLPRIETSGANIAAIR